MGNSPLCSPPMPKIEVQDGPGRRSLLQYPFDDETSPLSPRQRLSQSYKKGSLICGEASGRRLSVSSPLSRSGHSSFHIDSAHSKVLNRLPPPLLLYIPIPLRYPATQSFPGSHFHHDRRRDCQQGSQPSCQATFPLLPRRVRPYATSQSPHQCLFSIKEVWNPCHAILCWFLGQLLCCCHANGIWTHGREFGCFATNDSNCHWIQPLGNCSWSFDLEPSVQGE